MHGAASVGHECSCFHGQRQRGRAQVLAAEAWRLIAEHEGINSVLITGDAMARPMIEALEELDASGEELDLSSLSRVSSSAAVFSPTVKDRFLDHFPNLIITDSIGSTESRLQRHRHGRQGHTAMSAGGPTVTPGPRRRRARRRPQRRSSPARDVVGKLARGGNIPLGYYKDEKKTAETFVTGHGRQALRRRRRLRHGARPTARITLLGRGSVSHQLRRREDLPRRGRAGAQGPPGGLRLHRGRRPRRALGPAGRRGRPVPRGRRPPTLDDLADHCRTFVAGYKVPRELHLVDEIVRSPSGKPDYRWAKSITEAGTNKV